MSDFDFPMIVPAIRVDQPIGTFYLTRLSARALLRVTYSDRLRVLERTDEGYQVGGTQRKEKPARLSDIGQFIGTSEATFPTPIILAANYIPDEGVVAETDPARWVIERREGGDENCLQLRIPSHVKLSSIVDGQHRLHAFQKLKNPDRISMELPCAVFFDLPNPYQAYLFATVNFNQKKVDRSLAYELLGFDTEEEEPGAWTPEKTAVFLCRKLNTDPESALEGHIKVAAIQEQEGPPIGAGDWTVSTATVVDGLLRLFSAKAARDRDTMLQKKVAAGRHRRDLPDDSTPLRRLYLEVNDKLMYAIVSNYFNAVHVIFWKEAGVRSYIRKTVGVQALFDVLRTVAKEQLDKKDVREDTFAALLTPAAGIDFSDHFFQQASGMGRIGIRNAIMYALGLWDPAKEDDEHRQQYMRLVPRPGGAT